MVEDRTHPSTGALPVRWTRSDEWYAFTANPRPGSRVLLRVDESSYDAGGSAMGPDHPIAWCRDVGRGRAWFTAMGHTSESYAEPRFRRHLRGGILVAARRRAADCSPGPRLGTPTAIARDELRRRGLPVRVTCPRRCAVRLRLAGGRRTVRLRRGGTGRVRVRPRTAAGARVTLRAVSGATRQRRTIAVT